MGVRGDGSDVRRPAAGGGAALLRNEEDARDVVQSAYLSAFRSLEQFEGAAQLSTWLHRIVVNTALMRLRSRRRKPEESIEDLLPAFQEDGHHVEQFSDWAVPADVLLERSRRAGRSARCVDRLPDNYRRCSCCATSKSGRRRKSRRSSTMTPTAVKVRLHRARQALSTLLRRQYQTETSAAATV